MVAEWSGDRLTIDTPNQAIAMSRAIFAGFFGIPPENVLLRSPFLGGGFGSKAIMNGPYILAILAARMLQRPVKMVLPRDQMFGPVGHRAATQQRLRLAMDADGRLTALEHDTLAMTSSFDDVHRTRFQRFAQSLCQPGDRDTASRRAGRHRDAGSDAGAR